MIELRTEDKIILKSVKIHPNPSELEQLNELILLVEDWDYLISTIIDRGIAPLFYKKLPLLSNSSKIPEFVKKKLQQTYYKTFSRSAFLYEHFKKIAEALTDQDIPVIGLKGIYLSEWLYQDIGLRQFSDIDLLVKEKDGEKCLTILKVMGYKLYKSSKLSDFVEAQFEIYQYHPMILNGVIIEIHLKLHSKNEKYDLNIKELWKNAISTSLVGTTIYTLNTFDLLIYLCLHLDKHFIGGKVQFTCFNDITNVLEQYSVTIDWHAFIETCQRYNCEKLVFKYLVMSHNYINASLPYDIIQKYKSLLTDTDEQLFFKYLKGNIISKSSVPTYLYILKNIFKFSDIMRYIRDLLFPSRDFMIIRYKIKHSYYVLFYYPYRYYLGIRGVISHLRKNP